MDQNTPNTTTPRCPSVLREIGGIFLTGAILGYMIGGVFTGVPMLLATVSSWREEGILLAMSDLAQLIPLTALAVLAFALVLGLLYTLAAAPVVLLSSHFRKEDSSQP